MHLGIWKRADGVNAHTWADVKKKLLHLVRRLGRLRFAASARGVLHGGKKVLLLGMTNFGAQSTYITFEQAEEVEAKFRQAYYRRFGIASSTPRLQVYARTGKTEKPDCEGNPASLDCPMCKAFKGVGICSHVLAITTSSSSSTCATSYQLATIGKRTDKLKKGAPKRITPALERIPQREPDSSDEEEERALLLGGQGK